jgi:thioredoxin-related protein
MGGNKMLKILWITLLFLTTLYSDELGWNNDYTKALEQAKVEKKDVYMFITSANCRWCRKFEATTLQDEGILQRLKEKYVLLHIDRDADYMPENFKKKRVPRHYFLRANGEIIYSFLGYWANEDFASFLNDVDKRRIKQDNKEK